MKTLISLRAKRKRKYYKTDRSYLGAVFDNNKEWLQKMATYKPTRATLRKSFIDLAMEKVKEGRTARQAANILASSAAFAGKGYRGKINIYNVIMNDKKLYKKFKEETGIRKKSDFDLEKFNWTYTDNGYYTYDNVIVDVSNSPYRVVIRRKDKGLERIYEDVF